MSLNKLHEIFNPNQVDYKDGKITHHIKPGIQTLY